MPAATELTPRPPWVAEWDSLSHDQRRLYARQMECFAGFLAQSDLVKFARHAPGPADMHNALDSATRLVRETMPVAPRPSSRQEEDA